MLGGDHPRSRGVYHFVMPRFPTHVGSSPLARGLPALPVRGRNREGDHPRSRGVYPASGIGAEAMVGSSPLARGLRPDIRLVGDGLRIIPARAGFTTHRTARRSHPTDHPRSRGVYQRVKGGDGHALGSSPLARGLRYRRPQRACRTRIIPARAGFTLRAPAGAEPGEDHPRSRGVYVGIGILLMVSSGSSPLARGLLIRSNERKPQMRIIPARAGFTPPRKENSNDRPDHPRSRGVYGGRDGGGHDSSGSSPLARGLPRIVHVSQRQRRIIPARAGFTVCSFVVPYEPWDHPRSRGVYGLLLRGSV